MIISEINPTKKAFLHALIAFSHLKLVTYHKIISFYKFFMQG